jgi:hypothetical protein
MQRIVFRHATCVNPRNVAMRWRSAALSHAHFVAVEEVSNDLDLWWIVDNILRVGHEGFYKLIVGYGLALLLHKRRNSRP